MYDPTNLQNKLKNQKTNKNKQRIFVLGAAVAALVASGDSTDDPDLSDGFTSGDVAGKATKNADSIVIGPNGGVVDAGAGNDHIQGGTAADFIRGGEGADDINGGGGLDNIAVVGIISGPSSKISNPSTSMPQAAGGSSVTVDLQNVGGTGVDLSALLKQETLDNHNVSDLQPGESIDGGADGAILFVFGKADFSGVTLANITKIYLNDEVIISNDSLQGLITQGLTDLLGEGVIKASSGLLDLNGVNVPSGIIIQDSAGQEILPTAASGGIGATVNVVENTKAVGQFSVTDESSVGDVAYSLSGVDAQLFQVDAATGEINFINAPDFETPLDGGADNVYNVTVTATDQHGKSTHQDIAVSVTDVAGAAQQTAYVDTEIVGWGHEMLVNSQYAGSQSAAEIASLAGGGYVIVWESNDQSGLDTDSFAIKVQIYDEGGNKVGAEQLVNSIVVGGQYSPSVTGLSDGGFLVTWYGENGDSSGSAIKAQAFNAIGYTVNGEFQVNTQELNQQSEPVVTALQDGGYVIAWRSADGQSADGDEAIKAQMFNADGDMVGSEILVNQQYDSGQEQPSITALANGGIVITWTSYDGQSVDTSSGAIKAQVYDADANLVNSEFLVNTRVDNSQNRSSVEALSDGGFVVVWNSSDQQDADQIMGAIKAQIFDDTGTAVGNEILVNSFYQGNQYSPSVSAVNDGGFMISWESYDGQSIDWSGSAVKAQIFDSSGSMVGNEVLVNNSYTDNQAQPAITTLNNGDVVVVWNTEDQTGADTIQTAIRAKIFEQSEVFKFDTDSSRDFNIIINADDSNDGAPLSQVTIGNVPHHVTFNHGTYDVGTNIWTLMPEDLEGLQISAVSLNVKQNLEMTATFGTGPSSVSIPILQNISVGNVVSGGTSNDALSGSVGVDHVYGGDGVDTYIFAHAENEYVFELVGNDLQVTHVASGSVDVDLLHSVEKLNFSDQSIYDVHELDPRGHVSDLIAAEFDEWLVSNYDYDM